MSVNNPSLAAFLLDNGPRCVSVSYDTTYNTRTGKPEPADIKSFKTFDTAIQVDDLVVIPTDTRYGFTVGKVTAVDTRVNWSSSETMRWIAGRVDKAGYDSILAQEEKLVGQVAKAQEAKARRELAEELAALDPNLTAISLLGGPPVDRNGGPEADARGGAQPPAA